MGGIVLAAKVTHVPSIWMDLTREEFRGLRANALAGHAELGRRAVAAGVETFVIVDCHWIVNQGFHVNAKARHAGRFTSHELPHMMSGVDYAHDGDPELADAIVGAVDEAGINALAHRDDGLSLEYGTLIPMHTMNRDLGARVLPVAANQFASMEEGRRMGEAIAAAVAASGRRVALLASGSMSHAFWPNHLSRQGINSVNGEFNRQVDLRVLDLWRAGETKAFLEMLPDYASRCQGECNMIDTAMLFGALGWDGYAGRGEVLGEYFGSSGTGQVNVAFSLPE